MADKKISELDAITGADTAADDFFIVVDSSGSATKKISRAELNNAIERDVLDTVDINGGTIDGTTIGASSAAAITGTTITGTSFVSSGDMTFGDNDKAIFGAGSDLQIYHDGSNSYISEQGTGNLKIIAQEFVVLNALNTEAIIRGFNDGAVELYYDASKKLATTSGGIDVTGTAVTDGLTVAGNVSVDGGTIKLDGNYPTGTGNVALGDAALDDGSLSGNSNTAIGSGALTANTTASSNTAVGYQALNANTTGVTNVALGHTALKSSTTASDNIAIGAGVMLDDTTGRRNIAIGSSALGANTTADNNVGIGYATLSSNTTGTDNTATGSESMTSVTTASNNTAYGRRALRATTGSNNTGIGRYAGDGITSGSYNVAIGSSALAGTTGVTGDSNIGIGYRAGDAITSGTKNTITGNDAGTAITTGGYNTLYGSDAGGQITTGSKNTIIGGYNGNSGGLDIRTSDNYIVLSDGDGNPRGIFDSSGNLLVGGTTVNANDAISLVPNGQSKFYTGGQRVLNIHRGVSDGEAVAFFRSNTQVGNISVTTTATAYNTSSDYRLKENVVADWDATTRLKQLNPVRFNFIADADTTVDGFLAHEVQDIVPEAISGTKDEVDDDGNPVYQGIDQSKLVPLLVKTIQELEARIAALESN